MCALALHIQLLHYTFVHMGNNEITKIILLEKEIHCIFMAGALCMLTARGKKKIQLSIHAPLSFFLFLFLSHSFLPSGFC